MMSSGEQDEVLTVGTFVVIKGIQSRQELNGLVGVVITKGIQDTDRLGVNVNGEDILLKTRNMNECDIDIVSFRPDRERLDLENAVCRLDALSGLVYPPHREVVDIGADRSTWPSLIFTIGWNPINRVIFNLNKLYGKVPSILKMETLPFNGDMRCLSSWPKQSRDGLLHTLTVEMACACISICETEDEPKPWSKALDDMLVAYVNAVDEGGSDALHIWQTLRSTSGMPIKLSISEAENMAHWFHEGRMPRYFYGLSSLLMVQPKINDLNKCMLAHSPIGGIGGLGCFLRERVKAGELLTLYPCQYLGKHWSVALEGKDVERDHHVVAKINDNPEWSALANSRDLRLHSMAKRYSIALAPASGCSLMASCPPSSIDCFSSAWIAHMANSTIDGSPVPNCTLVPNLKGGCWWGLAAISEIAPGEECIVDYGNGWFESHKD